MTERELTDEQIERMADKVRREVMSRCDHTVRKLHAALISAGFQAAQALSPPRARFDHARNTTISWQGKGLEYDAGFRDGVSAAFKHIERALFDAAPPLVEQTPPSETLARDDPMHAAHWTTPPAQESAPTQDAETIVARPCCGEYTTCQRPCTPRGRELYKLELAALKDVMEPTAPLTAPAEAQPVALGEMLLARFRNDPLSVSRTDLADALEDLLSAQAPAQREGADDAP